MITKIMVSRYRMLKMKSYFSCQFSSKAEVLKQLSSFPEYTRAQALQLEGSYQLALPELERVYDVLSHSLGGESPMTSHVARQMSEAARLSGNSGKALSILNASISNISVDGPEKVGLIAMRSYQRLIGGGSLIKSREDAEEAVRICESHEGMHPDYFGVSYGLMGITCAFSDRNFALAEDYLQLAARWSQEPTAELCSLNNLGHYHLYSNREERGESSDYRMAVIEGKTLWGPEFENSHKVGQFVSESQKEAVAYWEEAIQSYQEQENRLSDVDYAIAYAGVLASCSQGLRNSDPTRASELLASALKSIDSHSAHPKARPMLGRILNLIAFENMSASMAVTAEGLFRSSLDHLGSQSPHAVHDIRFQFEHFLALGGYSLLTSKWENRVKDALELKLQSQRVFEKMNVDKKESSSIMPFPFLFPNMTEL